MWKLKIVWRRKMKPRLRDIYLKLKKKNMLKTAAIVAAIILLLLFVGLDLLLFFLCGWKVMLIVDAVLIVLAILAVLCVRMMEKLSKKWYKEEKPTSYFSDLRWRDTPGLVVGSTKAWKYTQMDTFDNRVYNCLTYRRSLDMDFATLKTYFSHVKKGGKIFLVVDYTEAQSIGDKITPRDFLYVHPHLFLALGKEENKKISAHPMRYMPKETIGHFFAALKKRTGGYRKSTWKVDAGKNVNIDTAKVYAFTERLDKILQFCWYRGLEPELLLLNGNKNDNQANEIIRAYLAPKYYFWDPVIINDSNELNNYIRNKSAEVQE